MNGGRPARAPDAQCAAAPALPPTVAALAALSGVRAARSDPIAAERAVTEALDKAPADLDVRLAAYRFYFYNHRLDEALPHAEAIIRLAARRLNIAADWTAVGPADAAFEHPEEAPGLFLQALLAWGYCAVRIGRRDEGRRSIAKVADLDPRDRFGARRLLDVIDTGVEPEDD